MKELEVIQVGGAYHETARVAMHPGWRHENGGNVLEDVAIIELDAPVTTVAPVTPGTPETAST